MAETNPGWLSPDRWLQALQLESSPSGRVRYVERLRTLAEDPEERQNLNGYDMSRGWAIGTAAWRGSSPASINIATLSRTCRMTKLGS